jgi:TRAP-type C4-dicarboxylate transport system permease small subunit
MAARVADNGLIGMASARLFAAHDALNRLSFATACVLTGLIACVLPYEIVARYFFNAPTDWASPAVSYFLVGTIFLAMPELTRQSAHIAITTILEALHPRTALQMKRAILVVSAGACLLAAWFSGTETFQQFLLGVHTIPPMSIPKWIVTVAIPYGMASSALYFVRHLAGDPSLAASDGAAS